MKKRYVSALMMLPILAWATANDELASQYFSTTPQRLTSQERAALAIGQEWQTGKATSKPVAASDGSIRFIYGSGQTQLLCAVLHVCDVALQPGEQVNNINVGDSRFTVEPAITETGAAQRLHLLIKPLDVGLDTSMVVTTTRRTYHFRLRSSQHDFMPYVSFTYPDDVQAKWDAIRTAAVQERHDNTLPQTGEYLGQLNFNYLVSGATRWKPCRVYNDGVKTIIDMPMAMQQTEAPALLVVRHAGLFSQGETVMVNYRVQHNRYIVDTVFDQAILVAGVGRTQEKITITRMK